MHFWPTSSTLSEDGGAAASGSPAPTGKGGNNSLFSMGAGMPAINAGEIMLSRAESVALSALDTEPNEAHGRKRARQESGLTDAQVSALQRRSKHALSKGITLKGVGYVRKPTAGPPEEPSLVRTAQKEKDAMVESLREQAQRSVYTLPPHSEFRFPTPYSMGDADGVDSVRVLNHSTLGRRQRETGCGDDSKETNSETTMAHLTSMRRRRRRS